MICNARFPASATDIYVPLGCMRSTGPQRHRELATMHHTAVFLLVLCHQHLEAAAFTVSATAANGGGGSDATMAPLASLLGIAVAMLVLVWMMVTEGAGFGFGFGATPADDGDGDAGFGFGATPEDDAASTPLDYDVKEGLTKLQGLNKDIKDAVEGVHAAVKHHNQKREEAEKLLGEINKAKKKRRIKCVRTSCSFSPSFRAGADLPQLSCSPHIPSFLIALPHNFFQGRART